MLYKKLNSRPLSRPVGFIKVLVADLFWLRKRRERQRQAKRDEKDSFYLSFQDLLTRIKGFNPPAICPACIIKHDSKSKAVSFHLCEN